MKKRYHLSIKISVLLGIFATSIFGQLSAPEVESVFGGRINAINGFAKTVDTTRIFISTESANSIFYADVFANSTSPVFGDFKVMPGVDATAGYGDTISQIDAHKASGKVFFIHSTGLLSSSPSSSSVSTIYSGNVNSLLIQDDYMFFTEAGKIHWGTLNATGAFSEDSSSPIVFGVGGMGTLAISPITDTLYFFAEGTSPIIYRFTDKYNAFTSSTSISDISPTGLSTSINWNAFNIMPDGNLILMGNDGFNKSVAASLDEVNWNEWPTGVDGVTGTNIAFSGDSTSFYVYSSNSYSNMKGLPSTWLNFGTPGGFQTHPNDGAVFTDPINDSIVYMTTDQGLGASINRGATIFEIDDGIEAVQVSDFSQTSSKYTGWIASKSGIRRVDNYLTSPSWTYALFPNGDGSPYYSIEMSHGDSTNVYAGNVRIYKTYDNGSSWNKVFTPESSPFNFPGIGTKALAITECPFDTNIVMAGFEIWDTQKGGLFVSLDAGQNWDQILLEASSVGQDVDVSDIVFNIESGDTIAYVSALYDLSSTQGRSVYKLTKNSSAWTVQRDMDASGTSTGSMIVVSIWDLDITSSGDTIYAAGTDAGINHPVAYYKPLDSSGLWTPMTTSGFPFSTGKEATAITIGIDTVYVAVDEEIYYYDLAGSSWQLGYSYPVGTRINFLFYDELLAGTSFGLFGHTGGITTDINDNFNSSPNEFILNQNYPNPFNPSTTIEFTIPQNTGIAKVQLQIFNILGEKVVTLINSEYAPGNYSVKFDASNLSSGIYFYKLISNNFSESKKMILMK